MDQTNALSFKEEFLTCSICTNVFTKPCTLKCGHSFCCECLGRFLLTRQDAIQANSIPCAYCRQFTRTPRPNRPTKEWAGQIQCSLLLRGLLDKFKQGKDGSDVCFLCQVVGEVTQATSWCSDCEITLCARCKLMHIKGPTTRRHDLYELSEGPQVKQKRKPRCKKHEGETMDFYCKDCNTTVCRTCCVLKHRFCRNVVTLQDMVPFMRASLEEFRGTLLKKTNEQTVVEKLVQSRITQLLLTRTKGVSKVQSVIETTVNMLKLKLEKAKDVVEKEINDQISQNKTTLKTAQDAIKLHQRHCKFIDKALQTDQDLVEGYQAYQSGALEIIDTHHVINPSNRIPALNTEAFSKVAAAIENIDIEVQTHLRPPFLEKEDNASPKLPFFSQTVNIGHKDDSKTPRAGEITIQDIEGTPYVILTDINNECLKSLYKQGQRYRMSMIKLSAKPWRMSRHESSKVVTTLGNRTIAIVEVEGGLRLVSKFETKIQYLGIASLAGGLLAVSTSHSRFSVDILDVKGNILKCLTSSCQGLELIVNPFDLCSTSEGNICVTDAMSKLIHCITPMGEVVFTYMPTSGRTCSNVTETHGGNILVTDYDANRIYLLNGEGRYLKDILFHDPVSKPLSVASDRSGDLFVCEDETEKIKVFTSDGRVIL